MSKVNFLLLIGVVYCLTIGCKKQDPSWEAEYLTPLVNSSLSFKDLKLDSSIRTDPNGLLELIYSKKLYDLAVDSIFTFSDTGIVRSFNIDSLSLYSSNISYPVTLGEICRNAGLLGLLILAQHGMQIAVPPISPISSPAIPINADSLFTTMTLNEGNIDVSLKNGLPLDITNVVFELKNETDGSIIVEGTFPKIAAGTTESQTFDLAGKRIDNKLTVQLKSLQSPGTNGVNVTIDTAASIVANLKVYNLHPKTATAVFPPQNLINKSQAFYLKGLPVELKDSKIKSGQIVLRLFSTLPDSIRFVYKLPSATKNGQIFEVYKTLDPAPIGGVSVFEKIYDFSGYNLSLEGPNKDTFNTAFNEFIAAIDYTGKKITLSKSDSFYAQIQLINLSPEWAKGYLGNQSFDYGPASVALNAFDDFNGMINLEQAKVEILTENYIGTEAQIVLKDLTSTNTKNNKSINLQSSVLNQPLQIQRAIDLGSKDKIQATTTRLSFDQSNSNINDWLSNLPNQIHYSIQLKTNPQGNDRLYKDFIYDEKFLNLNLEVKVPLVFSAQGIELNDTLDLDLNTNDLSNVISAELALHCYNQFPMDANIQLFMQDGSGSFSVPLIEEPNLIQSAAVDPVSLKSTEKKYSKLLISLNKNKLQQLLQSKQLKVQATLNSNKNSKIAIYNEYKLDFKLTAKFIYLNQ